MGAKVSFSTRTYATSKGKMHKIRINFSDGGGNYFRFLTGKSVKKASNFDKVNGKVREVSAEPNRVLINDYLRKLKAYCEDEVQQYELDNITITSEIAKKILLSYSDSNQREKASKKFVFNDEYEIFLRLIKGDDLNDGEQQLLQDDGVKPFSVRTYKNYASVFHLLKSFQEKYEPFTLRNIDDDTYKKLIIYLRDECEIKYKNSQIDKVIAQFKGFISNYVIRHKKQSLRNYISKNWRGIQSNDDESFEIYLDNDELKQMFELDLSDKPIAWANYRDAFLFIAFTCGIRVEDYRKCTFRNNIRVDKDGSYIFFYKQSKTGKTVNALIPLPALRILERNNWELPIIRNSQNSNDIIKQIGKLCGFNKVESWLETRGLKTETKKAERWELIKNHTARRSFCTNAYNSGEDSLTIMQFSGHKDFDVFLKYIRTSKEQFLDKWKKGKLIKMYNDDEVYNRHLNIVS